MIRTAFIYKQARREPVGASKIHNDTDAFANARKPLAQVFKPVGAADDKSSRSIANHFKSKGSAATPEDNDKGQGASNLARTGQATVPARRSPTNCSRRAGTDKVFLIGDFNAYTKEDPINVLTAAGYVNQDEVRTPTAGKHSYIFGGLVGLAGPHPRLAGGQRRGHRRRHLEHQLRGVRGPGVQPLQQQRDRLLRRRTSSGPATTTRWWWDSTCRHPASVELNFLGINDFHGRIDSNTVLFAGTIEKLRAAAAGGATAFLSAGDNIGASLFASADARGPADHRRAERPGAAHLRGGQPRVRRRLGRPARPRHRGRHATPSSRTWAPTSTEGHHRAGPAGVHVLDMDGVKVASSAPSPGNAVAGHPRRHRRPRVRRPRRRHQPRRREDRRREQRWPT